MNPSLPIPLAALALSCALSGCADPIIGEWELKEVGGYFAELEREYGAEFYGTLTVEDDLDAELEVGYCYSYDGQQECDSYDDDGEVDVKEDGEYEIKFDDAGDLTCELDDDELKCTFDASECEDCELTFERVD